MEWKNPKNHAIILASAIVFCLSVHLLENQIAFKKLGMILNVGNVLKGAWAIVAPTKIRYLGQNLDLNSLSLSRQLLLCEPVFSEFEKHK
jgi:hypothetical protein